MALVFHLVWVCKIIVDGSCLPPCLGRQYVGVCKLIDGPVDGGSVMIMGFAAGGPIQHICYACVVCMCVCLGDGNGRSSHTSTSMPV